MKKIILILLVLFPLFVNGQISISNLNEATTINSSDLFLLTQGSSSKKLKYSTLRTNVLSTVIPWSDTLVNGKIVSKYYLYNQLLSKIGWSDTIAPNGKLLKFVENHGGSALDSSKLVTKRNLYVGLNQQVIFTEKGNGFTHNGAQTLINTWNTIATRTAQISTDTLSNIELISDDGDVNNTVTIKPDGFKFNSDSVMTAGNYRSGLYGRQFGSGSNFSNFESDGTLTFNGNATVYDDLFFPFSTGKQGTTDYPPFNADSLYYSFAVDTTAPSVCVLYFTIQMPHSWKEGSTIYPHIHYKHETAVGTPTFKMKYKWYPLEGSTAIGYNWYTMGTTTGTTDKTNQMVYSSGGISGTGKGISSLLVCAVYLSGQTGTGDVHAYQFDIHYEKDTMGSRTTTSK